MRKNRQTLIADVGRATQRYQRATDGFDDEVGRRLQLNPSDLRCLDWLTEGPQTPGDLGALAGLSGAATTTLLDRLEERGYVRRVRDTVDRRRVVVRLTPDGQAKLGEIYGRLAGEGAGLLARFTDVELEKLRGFLVDAALLVDGHRLQLRAGGGSATTPRRSARAGRRRSL